MTVPYQLIYLAGTMDQYEFRHQQTLDDGNVYLCDDKSTSQHGD